MVMAAAFMEGLERTWPHAEVSVICKKGIHDLLDFFPPIRHRFVFSKDEYKGIGGLLRFGRQIKDSDSFDLFFCLPDSFSSALMGAAAGASKRVGYRKELRQIFFTHSYLKPEGLHRVEQYVRLLECFTKKTVAPVSPTLRHGFQKENYIVVNINSEASSRRLTVNKAAELLTELRRKTDDKIIMIGAPKEQEFVETVLSRIPFKTNIENAAGRTTLAQLVQILASAKLLLTTDSGPAHLANALGTYTIVLFGAGNEQNTAPYNSKLRSIIRLGELSCEPCEKNICVRYATPQCLERLSTNVIVETVKLYA